MKTRLACGDLVVVPDYHWHAAPFEVYKLFDAGPYTMKTVIGWINILNIGAYGTDYQTRAYVALMGLGALSKEDAVYPTAFVDSTGTALDGTHKYVMHFENGQLPPSYQPGEALLDGSYKLPPVVRVP